MILQALHRLAEREGLVADLDYEPKPVGYLVRVADGGTLLGLQSTYSVPLSQESQDSGKRKPKPRAKVFRVPREKARTSGDRALFLVDKAEYALGIDPNNKRDAKKLAKRFELFRERVARCAEVTGDQGVAAMRDFLEALAAGEHDIDLPDDVKSNDLFGFVLGTEERLIVHRPAVEAYFKGIRTEAAEEPIQCLITGEMAPPAELHTQVQYIPNATTSGVPLVSFNAPAFESYGWSSNENAPVSRDAAETYATALQRLLHPNPPHPTDPSLNLERRNIRLAEDTVVCYWAASDSGEELASLIAPLLEGNPEQVGNLYRTIWSGHEPELEDPSAFYALTLSGAQGRAAVRDWIQTTVAEAASHLARFRSDLWVVRRTPPKKGTAEPPPLGLRDRLRSLAPPGKSEVPGPMVARSVSCALRGDPFPVNFLTRAVQRYRAEIGKNDYSVWVRRDAQVGWIRAVLARRHRLSQSSEQEVTSAMDPNNDRPGYLLGRLMAVLERLQQEAMGDLNATVIDRFFSAASATPRAVFTRLLKKARHHARKARHDNKEVRWLEKQMDEIADQFEVEKGGFPAHLSMEEQGLFVLGYHQQRHQFFQKKPPEQAEVAASA